MSTRGLIGFRYRDLDMLTYNHYDSYPTGLGVDVALFCARIKNILPETRKAVDCLSLTYGTEKPNDDQILALKLGSCGRHTDILWQDHWEDKDWDYIFHDLESMGKSIQDPAFLLSFGYMLSNNSFIYDSLFCEWAYIINLDEECLEVYKGLNTDRHAKGRYAKNKNPTSKNYWGCKLLFEANLSAFVDDRPSLEKLMETIE